MEEEAEWFHNNGGYFPFVTAVSSDHTSKELDKVVQGLQTAVQQLTLRLGGWEENLKAPSKDPYPPFGEPQPVSTVVKQPRGPKPLSPLQAMLHQAMKRGEDTQGFHLLYPLIEQEVRDEEGQPVRLNRHNPIPFKSIKELKLTCVQYGSTAPYTQAMLEMLSLEALTPADWKNLARACLTPGDFLLWKSEYCGLCEKTALNRNQNLPILTTYIVRMISN